MAEVSGDDLVAVVDWLHAFRIHYPALLAMPSPIPLRSRSLAVEVLATVNAIEELIDTRKLKKPPAA